MTGTLPVDEPEPLEELLLLLSPSAGTRRCLTAGRAAVRVLARIESPWASENPGWPWLSSVLLASWLRLVLAVALTLVLALTLSVVVLLVLSAFKVRAVGYPSANPRKTVLPTRDDLRRELAWVRIWRFRLLATLKCL